MPEPVGQRRRSPRMGGAEAIREAAASLFLERGYQATSMDDVAARSGVSRQTIYTHFAGKEALLADLVLGNAGRVDRFLALIARLRDEPGDVEQQLRELARAYAGFVIRPEVLPMRRLVIAEASRFPELARTYHAQVPVRMYAAYG